jgi:putative hydroxymethylpyrimidine transport system substrate-binding protein
MLDYFPNADHAGIYAAEASGEYDAVGLDVTIQPPPDPSAPLKLLQAGRADVAISYEPELLLARDQGADLVSVGALVQTPLTSIISLAGEDAIRRAQDLQGTRVGTAGIPYQSAYLETILREAGVDPGSVKETNVGFNLTPAMISGRVDATLGSFWNYEGVDLERRGRNPVILRMEDVGVPTYNELIFVARRRDLDEEGASRLRRFLAATARGHATLREDPALGVDALLEADDGLDPGLQAAAVRATLPVFFPEDEDLPFGWQDPRDWRDYELWMRDNDLLTRPEGERAPLTNEFLPGEGLDPGVSGLE